MLARKLGLKAKFINKVPHEKMNELYWEADLVLGSFGVGQLDTVAIEAMACGRPVIHYLQKKFYPECPLQELASIQRVEEIIQEHLTDKKIVHKKIREQLRYVQANHSADVLSKRITAIYRKLQ